MTLNRSTPLTRSTALKPNLEKVREFQRRGQRNTTTKRRPISPASPQQRLAVAGRSCLICGESPVDPCHLIPRGMLEDGQEDARAVIGLCRTHHRDFDQGRLSVLEFLEPHQREELAFAVYRFGLISTLERVTNQRWRPVEGS
jgi:hypothetical protein